MDDPDFVVRGLLGWFRSRRAAVDHSGKSGIDFIQTIGPNALFRNNADGTFTDIAVSAGVDVPQFSVGATFFDYNGDGRLDLYVSNGDVHHLEPHEDVVFVGDGRGRFFDVSETAGNYMKQKFVGRGVAGGDFDNDGDVDVLITNLNDRPVLLRNDTPHKQNHWLLVDLIGAQPNRDAIGAVVRVRTGDRTQTWLRRCGGGYLSQHDLRLHFGVGKHKKIKSLDVTWPDGSRQVHKDGLTDRVLTIRQTSSPKKDVAGTGRAADGQR